MRRFRGFFYFFRPNSLGGRLVVGLNPGRKEKKKRTPPSLWSHFHSQVCNHTSWCNITLVEGSRFKPLHCVVAFERERRRSSFSGKSLWSFSEYLFLSGGADGWHSGSDTLRQLGKERLQNWRLLKTQERTLRTLRVGLAYKYKCEWINPSSRLETVTAAQLAKYSLSHYATLSGFQTIPTKGRLVVAERSRNYPMRTVYFGAPFVVLPSLSDRPTNPLRLIFLLLLLLKSARLECLSKLVYSSRWVVSKCLRIRHCMPSWEEWVCSRKPYRSVSLSGGFMGSWCERQASLRVETLLPTPTFVRLWYPLLCWCLLISSLVHP